ncbi:MAG TPA: alpha/beta fold hydrolase [Acidobacteriota bacterium]|nr:alpha/beta fold hydrolase [Acidobacteriota bacterium]
MTDQKHQHQKVRFPRDESTFLSGVLHQPASSESRAVVLLTHCFTCSKDYRIIVHLARRLCSRGFRVLRFDFSGSGESQGDFSETTLTTNVEDLVAAAEWLSTQDLVARALIGHSLGGVAAILAAHLIPEVRAVGVIASPARSTHLLDLIPGLKGQEFQQRGSLEVKIGGRPVRITRQFVEELKKHSLQESTAALNRPFLVVHGARDRTVSISEGEQLFGFARQPKSFFCVPDADHLFSQTDLPDLAGDAIAAWLGICKLEEGDSD